LHVDQHRSDYIIRKQTHPPCNDWLFSFPNSYLAYTIGEVPAASRSMIGIDGLFFFMIGYALAKKLLRMGEISLLKHT
jgi:hypothetical protein